MAIERCFALSSFSAVARLTVTCSVAATPVAPVLPERLALFAKKHKSALWSLLHASKPRTLRSGAR
jgi:hypothetical protein